MGRQIFGLPADCRQDIAIRRKTMLINGTEYELKPLENGDEDYIERKIGEYDHSVVLPVPGAEEET